MKYEFKRHLARQARQLTKPVVVKVTPPPSKPLKVYWVQGREGSEVPPQYLEEFIANYKVRRIDQIIPIMVGFPSVGRTSTKYLIFYEPF